MSKNGYGNHRAPSLLNSSFYSSTSMNTLEHAKNFRNSLIPREPSDQSLSWSHQSDESTESEEEVGETLGSSLPSARKDRETVTMQMKNSPSLSALAGILNEKSRQADERTRLSSLIDSSILKEEDEDEQGLPEYSQDARVADEWDQTSSPNLIDIHDTNSVTYPTLPTTNAYMYEQPDFLSTPKVHPRRNNNPFLQDYEPSKAAPQEPSRLESSILEEPELEQSPQQARKNTRPKSTSTILNRPGLDHMESSAIPAQFDRQRYSMISEPTAARGRSNSSLSALDQPPFDRKREPISMHTKTKSRSSVSTQPDFDTSSNKVQRTRRQSRVSNSDFSVSDDIETSQQQDLVSQGSRSRRHSRASTLEKPEFDIRRTHHRAHTIDHSYLGAKAPQEDDRQKDRPEKISSEEKLDSIPKRNNLRNFKHKTTDKSSTQRTVSAGSVLDQSSSNKRRSFFSLFKKKTSKETTPKKTKQQNKRNDTSIQSSSTFNSGSATTALSSPEKLTKKSHSTNAIFSTFRKNKDKEDLALLSSSTPPKKESQLDSISKESTSLSSVKQEQQTDSFIPPDYVNAEDVEDPVVFDEPKREDSHFESESLQVTQPSVKSAREAALEQESPEDMHKWEFGDLPREPVIEAPTDEPFLEATHFNDPLIKALPKPSLPFLLKHDAGEALFPKSLDKFEVESIVSLERSRSVKSNRSHRRSLTDTLSVNAQNEGMYVTEASPAVLSTPDLSKSPTSSILRNGRFDSSSIPYNVDDRTETGVLEKYLSEPVSKLSLSPKRSPMDSFEDNFHQLTFADDKDDEDEYNSFAKTASTKENATGDDPEFTSEMIEFASLINFGDGLALDLDMNSDAQSPIIQQDSPRRVTKNITQDILGQNATTESDVETDTNYIGQEAQMSSIVQQKNGNELSDDAQHISPQKDIVENQANYSSAGLDRTSIENSADIPDDLLEEIRSPSPQAFGEFQEEEDIPRERHSFRDILASQTYVLDDHSNRPVSMSFKGLGGPFVNESAQDWPLFDSQSGRTENPPFDTPIDSHHKVNFSSKIVLYDTYSLEEYDRRPEIATCNMLTPQSAHMIKAELNQLKTEMEVHEASRCYTQFF